MVKYKPSTNFQVQIYTTLGIIQGGWIRNIMLELNFYSTLHDQKMMNNKPTLEKIPTN